MTTASQNSYVTVHYKGTLDDGTEFDNSRLRGQPISFVVGSSQMIPQFEEEMVGMNQGESKTFTIVNAYGEYVEDAITIIKRDNFPEDFELNEETPIPLQGPNGPLMGKFIRLTDNDEVEIDLNHPLAGEDLTFTVEMLSVIDTPEPETADD